MASANEGIVYLVGAGPGDPGLITVRGSRLLEQADVVVYDYLANPRLLSYCPRAETVYVGKKAASHTMTQAEINALLVELGQKGKRVVRLKGGDPYVFGRGGEEGEALRAAGVKFEVVPGITAAIAAPCYAGIPVTHRDFNSSFTFITGHEKEQEYQDAAAALRSHGRDSADSSSDLDWSAIARLPCFAFYMGVKALPRICEKLIANGLDPNTPAATIQWGTRPNQRSVVATVATLARAIENAGIGSPAITIVGQVVSMRDTLNWFESRPLFGQTVVVTRTRQQASELSERLEQLGAEVIEAPTIQIAPPAEWSGVDANLRDAGSFDWIIFTSANGVTHAKQRMLEIGLDARAFGSAKLAAVGDATAEAIRRELCLRVDLCPESFVAEALADEMQSRGEVAGKKHLLLRADIARPILRDRLEKGGSKLVRDVAIYETRPAASLPERLIDAMRQRRVHWATFASSSSATNFAKLLGADYRERLKGVKIASIGPVTSATLRELGLNPTVEAATFNLTGLAEAIAAFEP